MVQLNLILALIFLALTVFLAAKHREWWLAAFALAAGILMAGNKFGVTVNAWLNTAAAWVVHLFQ